MNNNVRFCKCEILKSHLFKHYLDLLGVVLKDNKMYSIDETYEAIKKYLGGTI